MQSAHHCCIPVIDLTNDDDEMEVMIDLTNDD
jgi:hypothetical protein